MVIDLSEDGWMDRWISLTFWTRLLFCLTMIFFVLNIPWCVTNISSSPHVHLFLSQFPSYTNKILNYIASDNADTSLPDKHNQQSLSILLDLNSQIYPVVVTQGSPQPVIQYTFLKEQLTFTSVNLSSQELSVCHSVLWGELWLWACIR